MAPGPCTPPRGGRRRRRAAREGPRDPAHTAGSEAMLSAKKRVLSICLVLYLAFEHISQCRGIASTDVSQKPARAGPFTHCLERSRNASWTSDPNTRWARMWQLHFAALQKSVPR